MHIDRRIPGLKLVGCLAAAVCVWAAAPVLAQPYPNKPIRMVLPLPAGSATDVVARIIGIPYSQLLGQTIVMDNRGGADGAIAGAEVVRATPDGYTIMFGTNSPLAAVPTMRRKPPYDPIADFTPIGKIGKYTHYVVVTPSLPVKSMEEFLKHVRANPGKVSYATGNTFGILTIAQLQKLTGTKMLHVPYKSDPAALIDVIAGRVQFMYATQGQAGPFVREGKVRALAVTSSKRTELAPDVPTLAEAGLQFPILGWGAMVGPAKMPAAAVARLNKDLNAVFTNPRVIEEVTRQGFELEGSTPAEAAAFIREQLKFWSTLVNELGLQTD